MNNYLDGFDRQEITLKASTTIKKGATVGISSTFTTKTAPNGTKPAGICTYCDGKNASVLIRGYAEVSYTGDTPTLGVTGIVSNGSGGIKADASGRQVIVVAIDSVAMTCGIIF